MHLLFAFGEMLMLSVAYAAEERVQHELNITGM